jgi:hypothetical protein
VFRAGKKGTSAETKKIAYRMFKAIGDIESVERYPPEIWSHFVVRRREEAARRPPGNVHDL